MSLPSKYKACIYDKPGEVSTKVVELDMPEPASGEVLINLTHSGYGYCSLYPRQPSDMVVVFVILTSE